MTQQVKAFATKPEDLSLSPELITIIGETVLWFPQVLMYVHMYVEVYVFTFLWRPEESIGFPGAGVNRELWAPCHGHWVLNLGPLEK